VAPAAGELACGDVGEGRLAELQDIVEAVDAEARRTRDLAGVRVLVTAGGTREPIDPVRYIGNRSSGKTGHAIAEEAARRGAEVTLVTSASLPDPYGVEVVRVESAQQMADAVTSHLDAADVFVSTAAVADFRPARTWEQKVKKADAPSAVELVRTVDILAEVGRECEILGMPFIAEAEFPTTYASVEELKQQYGFEYLRRNVRLCAELGADIVKTNWPGDAESFAKLVEATSGIPVVLAGGSRLEDEELLTRMEQAVAAGAIGCSVGRNIFMHERPEAITRALSRVIRERWSAEKAHDALLEELAS
jgi:hypothetical protein